MDLKTFVELLLAVALFMAGVTGLAAGGTYNSPGSTKVGQLSFVLLGLLGIWVIRSYLQTELSGVWKHPVASLVTSAIIIAFGLVARAIMYERRQNRLMQAYIRMRPNRGNLRG